MARGTCVRVLERGARSAQIRSSELADALRQDRGEASVQPCKGQAHLQRPGWRRALPSSYPHLH
eukprot:4612908-Lingulodinium_polyedra.AAC.1